jgi:hypothetical protein
MRKILKFSGWSIAMDTAEVIPNDPGAGTPVMVYGPNRAAGTYGCVCDTGEASCGPTVEQVPPHVLNWLEARGPEIDAFFSSHGITL